MKRQSNFRYSYLNIIYFISFFLLFFTLNCTSVENNNVFSQAAQILNSGNGESSLNSIPLTQKEAAQGIKEALLLGIEKGVTQSSVQDGFFGNSLIKILWPPEALEIKNTMDKLGMEKLTEKAVLSMNRAAEKAAYLALPLFKESILSMTLHEALQIVQGGPTSATDFLKQKTKNSLISQFKPHITQSLKTVDATQYWGQVMSSYNQIPFVKKVNPSLENYVTEKSIEGLFSLVAQEEKEIRLNPLARSSTLLKRVFGYSKK